MGKTYHEGREYRRELGERPRQTSTPADVQIKGFPVGHHAARPMHHVETVGHTEGGFVEATHPNAEAKTGTDRHYKDTATKAPLGTLNRDHMKDRS